MINTQTFLPFPNFTDSVATLDRQRLGKQRVETYQIMITLLTNRTIEGNERKGWPNHPCVKMWRGYERSLLDYQEATVAEWCERGYVDTCWPKTLAVYREHKYVTRRVRDPFWLGDYDDFQSHVPLTTHQVAKLLLTKPDIPLHVQCYPGVRKVHSILSSGNVGGEVDMVVVQ